MFAFRKRSGMGAPAAKTQRTSLVPDPGGFPALDVREAALHLLRLLGTAVSYAGSRDASFKRQMSRLDQNLARATVPLDFTVVSESIRELTLPFTLADEPTAGQERELTRRAIRAARPVGVALEHEPVVRDLATIERDLVDGGTPDRALARFEAQMELLADAAGFVRRTAMVFRLSVTEMMDIVGSLARDEPQVLGRLSKIRERLVTAADVEELENLRGLLLSETTALVEETQNRGRTLHHVHERVRETQAQVEVLEAALVDAKSMAVTDPLTGLGNRRALEEALDYYAGAQHTTGVIAVDVDHFKRINDAHGHGVGDMVLRHVAHVLGRELRGDDRAFRVGGEELIVMLYDTVADGAVATGQRLCDRLAREPVVVDGQVIDVTASFGVASWGAGERFAQVAERADGALYRAKSHGRNRVERG